MIGKLSSWLNSLSSPSRLSPEFSSRSPVHMWPRAATKRETATETEEIENIIRSYYNCLYSTILENLPEMYNFLDRYQVSKLNQDQINHLNSPVILKEIEAVIRKNKTNKQKKPSRPDGFSAEFYQPFKYLIWILLKLFHKIEGTEPNYLYMKPQLYWYLNHTKTQQRKRTSDPFL